MPIQTPCPTCGRELRVPDDLVGKKVKCPSCQTEFMANVEGSASAPPPALEEHDEPPRRAEREEAYQEKGPARRRSRERDMDRDDDYDDDRPVRRERRSYEPHRGVMILIFGILGLAFCMIFGVVAWIMGNNDLKEIRAGRMDPEGE